MSELSSYDAEAVALLTKAAEGAHREVNERLEAAKKLLDDLVGLSRLAPGPIVSSGRGGLYVLSLGSGQQAISLRADEEYGGVLVGRTGDRLELAPLEYDPVERKWTGREFDEFSTPVPGKPRQKRSGLAVVIEEALSLLTPPRPPL